MPIFKKKNEDFFKKWSPEMAYVLGFFAADGCMIKNNRGAHFIEFYITDKDLLIKIKEVLGCDNKLSRKETRDGWKTAYRLQLGSKEMFNDLSLLGFTPRKSNSITLPKIPNKYFFHFVRGYFDGDGNVFFSNRVGRNKSNSILQVGFTCGSKIFLEDLYKKLKSLSNIIGGSLCYASNAYRLKFATSNSIVLYRLMYDNVSSGLFLERKKKIFIKYLKWSGSSAG